MNEINCPARAQLLRKIQQHYFAMVDACLYLDAHPYCKKALAYFKQQKAAHDGYVAMFEEKFGPLTFKSCVDEDGWKWIQGPWPWESEAN